MEDVTMIDLSLSEATKTLGILCPRCGTSTHPSMLDHGHVPSFQTFLDDVNIGMKRSIEAKVDYNAVRVLFIRWENDTLISEGYDNGVQGEIDSLEKILTLDYNFQTETWLIPHEESERALRKKIFFFEDENSDPSTLLLVYYGGHGVFNTRNQSIWAEGDSDDSPKIEWFSIQPQLEKSRSNVVLILDCCFAGSADASSINGNIQVLAACGREHVTIRPGDWSFTSRLAETLKSWSASSFTVTQLHAELVNLRALTGRKKLLNTPSHYIQTKSKCSVRIARLPSLGTPQLTSDGSSSEENLPLPVSIMDEPRVLISVSVDNSAREDPHAWLEWLRSHIPDYITGVRLEGLFGSHSTLGFFSLPIRVWDCVRDNAAYAFVSFTTTKNILFEPSSRSGANNFPEDRDLKDGYTVVSRSKTKTVYVLIDHALDRDLYQHKPHSTYMEAEILLHFLSLAHILQRGDSLRKLTDREKVNQKGSAGDTASRLEMFREGSRTVFGMTPMDYILASKLLEITPRQQTKLHELQAKVIDLQEKETELRAKASEIQAASVGRPGIDIALEIASMYFAIASRLLEILSRQQTKVSELQAARIEGSGIYTALGVASIYYAIASRLIERASRQQ